MSQAPPTMGYSQHLVGWSIPDETSSAVEVRLVAPRRSQPTLAAAAPSAPARRASVESRPRRRDEWTGRGQGRPYFTSNMMFEVNIQLGRRRPRFPQDEVAVAAVPHHDDRRRSTWPTLPPSPPHPRLTSGSVADDAPDDRFQPGWYRPLPTADWPIPRRSRRRDTMVVIHQDLSSSSSVDIVEVAPPAPRPPPPPSPSPPLLHHRRRESPSLWAPPASDDDEGEEDSRHVRMLAHERRGMEVERSQRNNANQQAAEGQQQQQRRPPPPPPHQAYPRFHEDVEGENHERRQRVRPWVGREVSPESGLDDAPPRRRYVVTVHQEPSGPPERHYVPRADRGRRRHDEPADQGQWVRTQAADRPRPRPGILARRRDDGHLRRPNSSGRRVHWPDDE